MNNDYVQKPNVLLDPASLLRAMVDVKVAKATAKFDVPDLVPRERVEGEYVYEDDNRTDYE